MAICLVMQLRFHLGKLVRVSFNINFFLFSVCSIISVIPKVVVDMWHIHALLEGMLHSDILVNRFFVGTHLRSRPYDLKKLRTCILLVHLQTFQILIGEYTTP